MTPSLDLKTRIRNAALQNADLLALLGTVSPATLRWYDRQLYQGSPLPAMVVTVVSNPQDYVLGGRLPTGWARVQFLAWASGDAEGAAQLVAINQAFSSFIDGLNLVGIPGLPAYNSKIMGPSDGMFPSATKPLYWFRWDVFLFFNSTISS